jgi:hypothetical protein
MDCGKENYFDKMRSELDILKRKYRSLGFGFDYYRELVKPEVVVIIQGQEVNLLDLSTEGRTRILMGCILLDKETTINQGSVVEAESKTNLFDEKTLMDKAQLTNMHVIGSDQDKSRLESTESYNLERKDMKFIA